MQIRIAIRIQELWRNFTIVGQAQLQECLIHCLGRCAALLELILRSNKCPSLWILSWVNDLNVIWIGNSGGARGHPVRVTPGATSWRVTTPVIYNGGSILRQGTEVYAPLLSFFTMYWTELNWTVDLLASQKYISTMQWRTSNNYS